MRLTLVILLATALAGCTDQSEVSNLDTKPGADSGPTNGTGDSATDTKESATANRAAPPEPSVQNLRYTQAAGADGYVHRGEDIEFLVSQGTPWVVEWNWDATEATLAEVEFRLTINGTDYDVDGPPPLRIAFPSGTDAERVDVYANGRPVFVNLDAQMYVSSFEQGEYDPTWSALP